MAQSYSASMPVYSPLEYTAAGDASVGDIGRAVVRHWRWVVIPTVIALIGSFVFVNVVSPRYTAEAKLLLQAGDNYYTRPSADRANDLQQIDEQAVASQVQVVMSRDLAREAIKRLGLVGNAEFDPQVGGLGLVERLLVMAHLARNPLDGQPEERVLDRFYDHLLVYPVGKSRIVSIEFRSKDRDLAARGANIVAELYLARQEEAKRAQARSASAWLGTNIDELRKNVAAAEAKVEAFRAKTGLYVGSGTTTLSSQQLSELSAQLAQARTARSDAEVKTKLIRSLIQNGRAFDIPDVANNELIRRLIEQRINLRAQLALELKTLLPQHPRIKELNAQLRDLDSQIRGAAERTVRTLENDSRIAGARVDSLQAAIDAQQKVVGAANEQEVQLRALERDARSQRDQLEAYLTRYQEATARNTDTAFSPDARIVSRAVAPQIPSFPKKLPIVALATFATLLLAVGAIVARELLADAALPSGVASRRTPLRDFAIGDETIAHELTFNLSHLRGGTGSLPVSGAFAQMPVPSGPAAPVPEDPRYDFGLLIARLSRADIGERGRRILVTATDAGPDSFDLARGISTKLASTAKTILIEVDPSDTSPVGAGPGLTDLVAGEAAFCDVIQREAGGRLHRVSAGTLVNEALSEASDGLDVALTAFGKTYDWVVCYLPLQDSGELMRLLAPRVDAVVIASNLEPANQILVKAYEAAQDAGAPEVVVAREQIHDSAVEAA